MEWGVLTIFFPYLMMPSIDHLWNGNTTNLCLLKLKSHPCFFFFLYSPYLGQLWFIVQTRVMLKIKGALTVWGTGTVDRNQFCGRWIRNVWLSYPWVNKQDLLVLPSKHTLNVSVCLLWSLSSHLHVYSVLLEQLLVHLLRSLPPQDSFSTQQPKYSYKRSRSRHSLVPKSPKVSWCP